MTACKLLAIILIFTSCTNSIFNTQNTFGKTNISFNCTNIDLGTLKHHMPKEASFTIKNSGDSVLLIQQVETSCGCTIPTWTKKPISVGDSGFISVTYDAEYPGQFHKTIMVFANVPNSPIELTIVGEVEYSKITKEVHH